MRGIGVPRGFERKRIRRRVNSILISWIAAKKLFCNKLKAAFVSPSHLSSAGCASKSAEHDPAHCPVDHGHRGLRQALVVLR